MNKSPYSSTKVIELGSCAFRQWRAMHSHCRFIHGYKLTAKFWFGGSALDEKNWICDFGGLKNLKSTLQSMFDHTLCVAADDPHLEDFKLLHEKGVVDLRIMDKGVGIERVAEFCYHAATAAITLKYGDRVWVEKIEVFEHEDNSAIYEPTKQSDIAPLNHPIITAQEIVAPAVTMHEPIQTPPQVSTAAHVGLHQSTAAHVGPRTTTGNYSGLFSGTNWG